MQKKLGKRLREQMLNRCTLGRERKTGLVEKTGGRDLEAQA